MSVKRSGMFLAMWLVVQCAAAQSTFGQQAQDETKTAQKFDSYSVVGECDMKARLDNFAIELQNTPQAKGYILVYAGVDDLPARIPGIYRIAEDYLINSRGLETERIVRIEGGYRTKQETQLWIVRENAEPPAPSGTVELRRDPHKAYQYDALYVDILSSDATDQRLVEAEPYSSLPFVEYKHEATRNAQGEVEREAGTVRLEFSHHPEKFIELVKNNEELNGHVFYYGNDEDGDLKYVAELVERTKAYLCGRHGLDSNRIVVEYGGYGEYSQSEWWIVPKGAPSPKPTVHARPENVATEDGDR